MAYSSRKSSVPNGLVVLSTPVVAKKYAGKFAALIVSMDVTGSTKTSHESIQEQFRTLCQTVAIEFDAFKEQVLVRGEFVSGGLWPGILQSIDRVEMPECDFGGSSPLIDA